jgi:hypothetical protein
MWSGTTRGRRQKCYSNNATVHLEFTHKASTLRRKVITSFSYHSGLIKIIIVANSYHSNLTGVLLLLIIIALSQQNRYCILLLHTDFPCCEPDWPRMLVGAINGGGYAGIIIGGHPNR